MLSMGLRLRMACECSVCEQDIDPSACVPRDVDGNVHVVGCFMLGICPSCLTSKRGIEPYTDVEIRRMVRRLKRLWKGRA